MNDEEVLSKKRREFFIINVILFVLAFLSLGLTFINLFFVIPFIIITLFISNIEDKIDIISEKLKASECNISK